MEGSEVAWLGWDDWGWRGGMNAGGLAGGVNVENGMDGCGDSVCEVQERWRVKRHDEGRLGSLK